MNMTLVRAFLRQRFTSPMRLGLLFLMTIFPLGGVAIMGTLSVLSGLAGPIGLILAAGAIGQDVSSGTLQLLLVRPVTRPGYLLSRWFAVVLATAVILGTLLVLGSAAMVLRGSPPDAADVLRMLAEGVLTAAGQSAVVIMFSTLVGGLGDIGLLFAGQIAIQMLTLAAQFKQWGSAVRLLGELRGVLSPELSLLWIAQGTPPPWFAIASYASTVTLVLAIGITRLNRREISYAAD